MCVHTYIHACSSLRHKKWSPFGQNKRHLGAQFFNANLSPVNILLHFFYVKILSLCSINVSFLYILIHTLNQSIFNRCTHWKLWLKLIWYQFANWRRQYFFVTNSWILDARWEPQLANVNSVHTYIHGVKSIGNKMQQWSSAILDFYSPSPKNCQNHLI